jgi:hypothetical protein
MNIDPACLSMTEIIRLQTLLSHELARRFEVSAALGVQRRRRLDSVLRPLL